ncbi:MAG: mechanosensitive ion channel [Cyclobacteriaceae bacterium]
MDFYQSLEANQLFIIQSIAAVLGYVALKYVLGKIVERTGQTFDYQRSRVKVIKKIINFILFMLLVGLILTIWGVDQSKLVYFLSTLLTVLGIAFFAQWSIISNITSSLIIFFNHPIKIGDSIKVLDKEFQVEGKIADIGIFFLIIKTAEGQQITMPSNLFMQKMILRIEK